MMNETANPKNQSTTSKPPWHLWAVGIFGCLWDAMGVTDFVMTQTKNEAYMSAFTEQQLDYFYGFPLWAVICWAIAVFGGLLGSVLLLFRSKMAVPVYGLSMVGFIATVIYNYALTNAYEITGQFAAIFTVVIFLIALFLLVYSIKMKNNGVLR